MISPRPIQKSVLTVDGGLAVSIYAATVIAAAAVVQIIPLSGYSINLLMQSVTYAIAVLGLTVVLGYAGQLNLAQAAFFGIGAYSVALGTTTFALSFWMALVVGVVLAAVAGVVLGLTTLRLGGHYLAMATISFQTILTLVLTNWIGLTRGPDGVPNIKRPSLLVESRPYLGLCVAALITVAFVISRLKHAKLGRAMRAVRDNELAAGVVGVNTYRTKVVAFTFSAVMGGLGGALFAGGFGYVSPDQFSFSESVVFLTMVLLGGAGAPAGALLGTGLLILLPESLRFLKVIYLAVYGAAVILIMILMPDGIWGSCTALWRRWRPQDSSTLNPTMPLTLMRDIDDDDGSGLLEVQGLSKTFGGLKALDHVDFRIRRNTVHALIGPNGSGKTTLLNVVNGISRPSAGIIRMEGVDITNLPPYRRAGHGFGRTFQNIRLFSGMSVIENVMVGADRPHLNISPSTMKSHALAALQFVDLASKAHARPGDLSYGQQRLVEIARALAGTPKLLLLDEPGAGLNHGEKDELANLLRRLRGFGLTILIIDHDMALVGRVADHATVLNFGRLIADGSPNEVLRHPEVVAAYLGEETPAHERPHATSRA